MPLGFVSEYLHWSPVAVFSLNFFALVPLALILGDITEDLAVRFGQTIGGLVNATFGNGELAVCCPWGMWRHAMLAVVGGRGNQ